MAPATCIVVRLVLQAPCLVDAALAYMIEDLIPNRPAACFELGMRLYPHLGIEGKYSN